jgi:D-arabinose 1-dehydrogenase-like Zn-dependent alcohol dehydrogenase
MLILAQADDERGYRFGDVLAGAREILVSGGDKRIEAAAQAANPAANVAPADDGPAAGPFDDIILLGITSAADVARAADALAFRGVMNLVGDEPLDGDVEIDLGRLHYHYTAYVGTTGLDVAAAYGEARNRTELRPGGVTVVVGAAGPMGQMHVERALGLPDGPRLVLAVDLDADRLAAAEARLGPVARSRGRELVFERLGPEADALRSAVERLTGGRGADDIIVTAPSAAAVVAATAAMAPDGMLVLFAGVPVGTRASIDLSPVFLQGAQFTGTSGSRIADQALVVEKSLAGQLEPRRALAAVGGMEAAQDALQALVDGRFPGKIVIFPALRGLPLTGLPELAASDPAIASALDANGAWTTEAEAALFARYLAG